MSKNKVGKEREGKERKGRKWVGIFTCPWRTEGLSEITNFCTRVKVSNVMTCAHFGVDILRDVGSGGGTNLVFPLYSVVGPYNCSTNQRSQILEVVEVQH